MGKLYESFKTAATSHAEQFGEQVRSTHGWGGNHALTVGAVACYILAATQIFVFPALAAFVGFSAMTSTGTMLAGSHNPRRVKWGAAITAVSLIGGIVSTPFVLCGEYNRSVTKATAKSAIVEQARHHTVSLDSGLRAQGLRLTGIKLS